MERPAPVLGTVSSWTMEWAMDSVLLVGSATAAFWGWGLLLMATEGLRWLPMFVGVVAVQMCLVAVVGGLLGWSLRATTVLALRHARPLLLLLGLPVSMLLAPIAALPSLLAPHVEIVVFSWFLAMGCLSLPATVFTPLWILLRRRGGSPAVRAVLAVVIGGLLGPLGAFPVLFLGAMTATRSVSPTGP
ncbi:MAG: hypothetical protein H6738_08760 [Alphaproteobacteria bacterium]|nr:hypothetical protein [Alphaproteobacteria bacterium]MCB9696851.1 hypothetical protein [Alphaproteobacteria bacterium]